jgi:malate permease and related proteins
LNTFIFAMNAIMPIVILIGLGYLLKRMHFFDVHFFNLLNKYVFRIALPALLFYNIYKIEDFSEIKWGVVLFAVIVTLAFFTLGILVVTFTVKPINQKGVMLQAITRSNFALIGIPLAQTLGGFEALVVVALLSAVSIPLANVLSIVALSMFQRNELGERISFTKMIENIIKNPLIIGVFTGLLFLLIRGFIPTVNGEKVFLLSRDIKFSIDAIRLLSVTASPMALIALGGQFEISAVKELAGQITQGVLWRIVIVPGVALTLAYIFRDQISGMEYAFPALIALFGTPAAVSSAIMASEMGGDAKLAGQIVVWTTIFSMFTLYFTVVIFRMLGMF